MKRAIFAEEQIIGILRENEAGAKAGESGICSRFKSQASAQRFLTVQAAVYNTFYTRRHLATPSGMWPLGGL